MFFDKLIIPAYQPKEEDDDSTESTQKLVRHSKDYPFEIILEIIQVHTKQNIE